MSIPDAFAMQREPGTNRHLFPLRQVVSPVSPKIAATLWKILKMPLNPVGERWIERDQGAFPAWKAPDAAGCPCCDLPVS